ncbi:serine hydrolase domain-containing protein [Gryllotalpicola ginsengisoli]|uniref:serine hydrolase domain-containing protein n=1 Tax=Gryllotalpicola ginsengisoli TaxID=444608 RepID=UPI0003B59565|nr:serine hydrolase domain-containing protein [Gryllotalpicola ginsengisoli]
MDEIEERVRRLLEQRLAAGAFSGAAVAVAVDGRTAFAFELGHAASVDASGETIDTDAREPVTPDTLFDLASLTKVFSAHTLLRLVERGVLELERPLADTVAEYRDVAKAGVTLEHLLTHTSGLPATWHGWEPPLRAALAALPDDAPALMDSPLVDSSSWGREALHRELLRTPLEAAPGERFEYACTGYNTAMVVAERASGRPWHELVRAETLDPLGLAESDVRFDPPAERAAATELQPQLHRGLVRGRVHDETAWALGGRCANAGLFGTARAVLAFTEAIREGRGSIFGELMWRNRLAGITGRPVTRGGYGASLGLRIGQLGMMGRHAAAARGHTGFTGTSLQTDREAGISIVLLTNRVHPTREGGAFEGTRAAVADAVYEGLGRGSGTARSAARAAGGASGTEGVR